MREIETRAAIIVAARRRARKISDVQAIIDVGLEVGRSHLEIAERIVKHIERHYGENLS